MNNLTEKIQAYREYKRLAEEAAAIADSVADEIKQYLSEQALDKLEIGAYKVSHTEQTRTSYDFKRMTDDGMDLSKYAKTTPYKVFRVV
jgi:hypothetical protein